MDKILAAGAKPVGPCRTVQLLLKASEFSPEEFAATVLFLE